MEKRPTEELAAIKDDAKTPADISDRIGRILADMMPAGKSGAAVRPRTGAGV